MIVLIFTFIFALLTGCSSSAQTQARPLYELPPIPVEAEIDGTQDLIVGNDQGLYKILSNSTLVPLWTEGKVLQILRNEVFTVAGDSSEEWYFVTSKGILFSNDLKTFEFRNNGLPQIVIHHYENKESTYIQECEELKDLAINPLNPTQLVTATKENVYISYDGAMSWKSIGSMSKATAGIKAVAIADMPHFNSDGTIFGTDLVVFMSHPIFGLSYILPNVNKPEWTDVKTGFKMMETLSSPDEISDILSVAQKDENGLPYTEVYISQTFLPNIYRFNWETKKGELIYKGNEPSDTIDSLVVANDSLLFVQPDSVNALNLTTMQEEPAKNLSLWRNRFKASSQTLNTVWIPKTVTGYDSGFALNELWMLYINSPSSKYMQIASDKKSLYIPPYSVRNQLGVQGITKYTDLLKENNLNSAVIDMKDDYGLLRYQTNDPYVLEKATVSQYAVDIDLFVAEMKKNNIYLIARIVAFKDRNLSRYDGGKYAVWDSTTKKPWIGIKGYEDIVDAETGLVTGKETQYYDENWVDPYSPEVWEYNAAIAKELISRGFDEIQFDYIRFPTDGYNLRNATFRWQENGMTKETALMSFLAYARENIKAPLGIDIYGANGWYRTGARTGQDVEMLSRYVDVICPMFYPSHFEQEFLDFEPRSERPYRVYFYGSYRNTIIGRNKILVRPWVQAFKLNVRYDRLYYGKDYVQQQLFGIRDSIDKGYMYWNNLGNYEMIQPDIGDAPYQGIAPESSAEFRKPTFGGNDKTVETVEVVSNTSLSVLDTVRNFEHKEALRTSTNYSFFNKVESILIQGNSLR